MLLLPLPLLPAVTFELKNDAGKVMFTFTATTDANGLAKVTLPAEAVAVK
jgi:hypothetical protein